MDRLHANQSLRIDEELASNNGAFRLRMTSSGGLVLDRKQVGHTVWSSFAQPRVGAYAMMQPDGSFVLRWPQGAAYWSTPTAGHPGAFVVLQDDGNLVVFDSANRVLWTSQSAQDMLAPTIRYVGEGGYSYNETSESWKQMCTMFPCFLALQWPGYASTIVEDEIDGQPVVIQLWKGLCQKFLGFAGVQYFPGGVGAEVGIYRRIPGKVRPTSLPLPPGPLTTRILSTLQTAADNELWWPFPELGATIEMTFTNPVTGEMMFSAGPQISYWLTKWMDEDKYAQYQRDKATPAGYVDYILEYKINGRSYAQWADSGTGDYSAALQAAWQLLLS